MTQQNLRYIYSRKMRLIVSSNTFYELSIKRILTDLSSQSPFSGTEYKRIHTQEQTVRF